MTTPSRAQLSRQIARRSRSNLEFALGSLPRERRRDMVSFYAFCRVIDDIADDNDTPVQDRRAQLNQWKEGLLKGFAQPDELQSEVVALTGKYSIPPSMLGEIVDGMIIDLDQSRFGTFDDLRMYCYKVASVVGLFSIEIFGCTNPSSKDYAVNLGYALQLTNIVRDVGEDARNGRIYLPQEDLKKFGVSEEQILQLQFDSNVDSLLQFQYDRAVQYYSAAAALLPEEDRPQLQAAEMMAQIYSEILEKIRRKHFRVFEERVSLSKLRKLVILGAYAVRGFIGRRNS